jgi:hypothetical protein
MNVRRLARWAVRATVIGALLSGVVYTATEASAGAIWNIAPPSITNSETPAPEAPAVPAP